MGRVVIQGLLHWSLEPHFLHEALGTSTEVILAGRTGSLILPRWNPNAVDENTVSLPLVAPERFLDGEVPATSHEVVWGHPVSWPSRMSQIRTVLLELELADEDDDELRRVIDEVHDAFEPWFASFNDWLGVLTAQDLVEIEPRNGSPMPGQRFSAWFRSRDGVWRQTSSWTVKLRGEARDNASAISTNELQRAASSANQGLEVPDEYLLLRDARASLVRHHTRRSALDSGLAGELVTALAIRAEYGRRGMAASVVKKLDQKTFGGLVKLVQDDALPIWLPTDITPKLVKVRNKAAHTNTRISRAEAEDALTVAESLVKRYVAL